MRFNASLDACSSDVVIELAEPLGVLWAAVSGVCLAVIAAALLYLCCQKRFEHVCVPRHLEVCEQKRDCDSESQRSQQGTQPAAGNDPLFTVSSDVTAFALKARVVYPISQRFRPLADGASNPSLHDPAPLYHDSASSSGDDWLRQEMDDDESSQCSPAHTSHLFRKVQHYPQTLALSRTSLLCLTLQELHLHTTQLQRDKYSIFLKILQVLLGDRDHNIIHMHMQDIEQLKREMEREDEGVDYNTVTCSVGEVVKTGRQKLVQSLQMAKSFAKQLERLCQNLCSKFNSDDTQKWMHMLMNCLQQVESVLAETQASVVKTLSDRFEWWVEVSDWLREKTALLKQEAELVVKLTGQSLQQLRADGWLEKQRQLNLREFGMVVNEELQLWIDEIWHQTEELTQKHCKKLSMRRKRMMKAQSSDWNALLSDTHIDAQHMVKVLLDLQVLHWNQRRDFEIQQDGRITDSLCKNWKSLFDNYSRRLTDLSTECIESNIQHPSAAPSTDLCQSVLHSMKLSVTSQMQREERHTHKHMQWLRERLHQYRQVWTEDHALTLSCLNHFGEQQRKIMLTMISRHPDVKSFTLIEDQQLLLILELQRILSARYFYLRTLKEMQHSQLNTQVNTQSATQENGQSDAQGSCVCVAVPTASREAAVINQNLQYELLSELETVTDMLQEHAHFLFGHALACSARLQMSVWTNRCLKESLMDAVCESVFVTQDSVLSLISEYYSRIQHIAMATSWQPRPYTTPDSSTCTAALQTELKNWSRNPASAELQYRIVELKTKFLKEFEKKRHNLMQTHIYRQELADEEEAFICRLAALARVSLDSTSRECDTDARKTSYGATATSPTAAVCVLPGCHKL